MVAANIHSIPAQAGAAFNNVTRQLRSGLWKNGAEGGSRQGYRCRSAGGNDEVNRGRQAA
jgi:hypothetical protein